MACNLEEEDIQNKKKEESHSSNECVLSSPLSAQTRDKKSVDKGKVATSCATLLLNVWYQYHNFSYSKILQQQPNTEHKGACVLSFSSHMNVCVCLVCL